MYDIVKTHKVYEILICFVLGITLWHLDFMVDMQPSAWHIFSVFIAVIISFILRPFPMGMSVMTGLIILSASGELSMKESLSGFADTTVWLVIAAFLLAQAVIDTRFGYRLALLLVVRLGKTLKGLAYALCGSEFLLASVMPSNTARGGGIHAPIVDSLAHSLGSHSDKHPEKAGQYLSLVGAHANLTVASMFMTGMAANPLITKAANDVFGVDFGWTTWILGAIVPGLIALVLLPQLLHFVMKPTLTDGSAAQTAAKKSLNEMGLMHWKEKIMLGVLVVMLLLWTTKFLHGMGTTLVAWLGVIVLLLTKAQSWNDITKNYKAWDTLIWLGGLLTMANMLLEYGFISWFVDHIQVLVSGYSGVVLVLVLGVIYFYSMYAFSMLTGHIAAMVIPFFAVCLAAGTPPMISIAIFAYFSCICGCMTNYSSGPIIIYYGLGYVEAPRWFSVGFVVSIFHLLIWIPVGLLWWKFLGWW
ncbi:MAG: DASS family sodium-coupled anion symporter [Saprospiraceae bacterium]